MEKPNQPKLTKDIFVSLIALAGFLGITPQRVSQLTAQGMPREDRGSYPLLACARFYINFLRNHVESANDSIGKERLRLIKERAERAALENQKLRNKVIDVDGITQQIMELMQKLRDGMLAISGRICHELEGKTAAEIRLRLDAELKQSLNLIADQLDGVLQLETEREVLHDNKDNGSKLSAESGGDGIENQVVSKRGRMGEAQPSLA